MPNVNRSSGPQLASVLGTIALLVAHFVFFTATYVGLGLMVMTTDSCGSRKCGDPAWLDRATYLALWAGGAFLVLDVLVTVIRLVRHRVTWVVPLLGCVAQLALTLGAAAMAWQAGPV
jgi:hypothetical protein